MSNQYKRALEKIDVPPELLEKTAARMNEIQDSPRKAKHPGTIRYTALAACVATIVLLLFVIKGIPPKADIFVTKLNENTHTDQVELAGGLLIFQRDTGGLSVTPGLNLGGASLKKEEWTPGQYREYLGADATPGHLPSDLALSAENAVVYLRDGNILTDVYTMQYDGNDGRSLTVSASKDKLPPQCDLGREENSHINGHPLAVGFHSGENGYWAQFLLDGAGVFIETSGLSQKEFVEILYTFFDR